jgi:hypothetical protein
MNKIIAYYTLCAVSNTNHPINNISSSDKNAFTKREIDLFFRKKDGMYVPRETVVGASEESNIPIRPHIVANGGQESLPWYLQRVGGVTYDYKCIVY